MDTQKIKILLLLPILIVICGNESTLVAQDMFTFKSSQIFIFRNPVNKVVSKPRQINNVKTVKPKPVKTKAVSKKSTVKTPVADEPIAPEDWINEQADAAIEERKIADSEPFLSLSNGYLNARYTFCESPQFPEAARRAKQKSVSSEILVTVGNYGGVLNAKALKGDDVFRANVFNSLGSMQFRQSYFMGKPIRIEGILNFTQNPSNSILCSASKKDVEIPTIIEGGELNEYVKSCEAPQFPSDAKSANLKTVEARIKVLIDAQGKVIEAISISGHPSFAAASVKSSLKIVFPKSLITGKPVNVRGELLFKQDSNNSFSCMK